MKWDGCTTNGNLDGSKFSDPMPWIGLYAAAASLACALAMALDACHGVLHWKLCFINRFFPSICFSLNAVSLSLLTIATKLPVDLNTSMPRRQDQLAKLSGTVLVCIAMGNFMPSLGAMGESEMLTNVVALGILVVTVVINVAIQMGTGVIYSFLPEHAGIMLLSLSLLAVLGSSAVSVPTTKRLLEQQFKCKHPKLSDHGLLNKDRSSMVKKLEEDVKKYWVMAVTGNPQYVIGRSSMSTASGAFCLLSALVFLEAVVRSLFMVSFDTCSKASDYKRSSMVVLISQAVAILVGTVAPALRWLNNIGFHILHKRRGSLREHFRVEKWWILRFVESKEKHLPFGINSISSRRIRKIAYISKNRILDVLIRIQTANVLMSKSVQLLSVAIIFLPKWLLSSSKCKGLPTKLATAGSTFKVESKLGTNSNLNLRDFVLCLEGEDELVQLVARNEFVATDQWIQVARKCQPTYLTDLLRMSTASQGFKGVFEFDSDQVPSIAWTEPPNCWALPLVTLTSIAVALPNTDQCVIKSLLHGVHEGLRYVRLVEKTLDAEGLRDVKEAAGSVWLGVDVYNCWFDEKLCKFAKEGKCSKKVLEELADLGSKHVLEFWNGIGKDATPLEWPPKVLAANSMYRVCQTILQDYDKIGADDKLFEWLQKTIADILAACITNLPHVISKKCLCSAIEVRVVNVSRAVRLLGEAEIILETVGQNAFSDMDPNQMAFIDEWRRRSRRNRSCGLTTSEDSTSACTSDEISLCIE